MIYGYCSPCHMAFKMNGVSGVIFSGKTNIAIEFFAYLLPRKHLSKMVDVSMALLACWSVYPLFWEIYLDSRGHHFVGFRLAVELP